MPTLMGNELSPDQQAAALARFPHRYTMEHVPRWAMAKPPNVSWHYAPQFESDKEWLANTRFHVTRVGALSQGSHYCETGTPTWPLGRQLDHTFRRGLASAPYVPNT